MKSKQVSAFNFSGYREFLEAWISSRENGGRGLKTRIAEEIGSGSGFITQVFSESAQFSLEQGLKIARWMALSSNETEFFILLIEKERAGTPELRDFFETKMKAAIKDSHKLLNRLDAKKVPEELDQNIYFSSWVYAAVHVALTCRDLNTENAIAKALGVSPSQVRGALDFLARSGFVNYEKGRYRFKSARMHLGTESPFLLRHHINWSLRAIAAAEADITKGLHYSSVISLSRADQVLVREMLAETISKIKELVAASEGEKVLGFNINFFEQT